MSFLEKPAFQFVVIATVAGALLAPPAASYAATDNQKLGVWEEGPAPAFVAVPADGIPLVVVDPVNALPVVVKPQPSQQMHIRSRAPISIPVAAAVPTSVDLVNKTLNPGASDPNVPLPQPGLGDAPASSPAAAGGPRIFGRQEEGGGVLGFRLPIPVDRAASAAATRYSGPGTAAGTSR